MILCVRAGNAVRCQVVAKRAEEVLGVLAVRHTPGHREVVVVNVVSV